MLVYDAVGAGRTLKTARRKRHWTQEDLVMRTQVPRTTICRLEAGVTDNPGIETVARLCQALRIDLRRLLQEVP